MGVPYNSPQVDFAYYKDGLENHYIRSIRGLPSSRDNIYQLTSLADRYRFRFFSEDGHRLDPIVDFSFRLVDTDGETILIAIGDPRTGKGGNWPDDYTWSLSQNLEIPDDKMRCIIYESTGLTTNKFLDEYRISSVVSLREKSILYEGPGFYFRSLNLNPVHPSSGALNLKPV